LAFFWAPIIQELGFSTAALSFYLTLFQLAMIVSLPIAGRVLPKTNLRLTMPIAIIVMLSGFVIMSQGRSLF
jgi:predicted MFS family arabinose efflux permease